MLNHDQHDDFDPDSNYYDNVISENYTFSTFDSFNEFSTNNPVSLNDDQYISIVSQNIRSLNANLENFLLLFDENNMPDVFVFSETWKDLHDPIIIPGYAGYHTVRHGRSGGVSVFVKSHINSEIIDDLSFANNSIEICAVKITNGSHSLFVFGIYRPFSDVIDAFTQSLDTILSDRRLLNQKCLFLGDFNANILNYGMLGEIDRLVDMMQSHHYIQVISD